MRKKMRTSSFTAQTRALSLILCLFACGCQPKPSIIKGAFQVEREVNPDAKGDARPVVVRVYELKSLAVFNSSDYFSLFDHAKDTLGADLVTPEKIIQLMPCDRNAFETKLQPDTRFIGVVAAFRDVENSDWRASAPITPNKVSPLTIKLHDRTVVIDVTKPVAPARDAKKKGDLQGDPCVSSVTPSHTSAAILQP